MSNFTESQLDAAGRRLTSYLRRLPLSEPRRLELAGAALKELEAAPLPADADPLVAAMDLLLQRLDLSALGACPQPGPALSRRSMTPEPMDRRPWLTSLIKLKRALFGSKKTASNKTGIPSSGAVPGPRTQTLPREYLNLPWSKVAKRRRVQLLVLLVASTWGSSTAMASILPHKGGTLLEAGIVLLFALLFAWISVGFWTAMAGFFALMRRIDRFMISRPSDNPELGDAPIRPNVRTALLFPICNEDPDRIMAGIKTTYQSLERTGKLDQFDVHILSDTPDPDAWVEEELAWTRLCKELNASGRIFYRRRRVNLKRKSGNVADFCKRYGAQYTYMIVFDADSVMSGTTLTKLVTLMERKRHVGILQTAPVCAGRETLIARAQQFASRVYGPMFAAGLHFWQLGDAQFWGHNAIIRVRPFMEHCSLPRLPGKPPLGGDIMSHDFVESALMRRAGWGVWLAYDLGGSYEEVPPTLLAELKRDRRWCQGNMQHIRLVFTKGLFPAHRALFITGVMSYVSALLWFLFLAMSTAEAVYEALAEPSYFGASKSLFPIWPIWHPKWALILLATTGIILFLPKVFSILLIVVKGSSRLYGGAFKLVGGFLIEVVLSTLLAPIRMLFHSKFVFATLLGRQVGWGSQQRDDSSTSLGEALRFHSGGMLLGLLWGGAMLLFNPSFFWWLTPILASIILSVPISMLTSRADLGRWLRRHGYLLTPEEVEPARELRELVENEELTSEARGQDPAGVPPGFARAALDPLANRLRCALQRGPRRYSTEVAARRDQILAKALEQGPKALSKREKLELLSDPERMERLHREVWRLPETRLAAQWTGKSRD